MAAMKSQSEKYTAPQKYLTSETRDRILDLIKERKITQSDLAKKAGLQESTLSRFLQGKIKKLGDGSLIKLARVLNVSTDFLLGETDIPDRLNYDIDELGLSAEAAKLLFTRRVDPEMLNQLIENPRFPKLLLLLKSYQDNSLQAGYQSMNNIMGTWSSLLLGQAKNYPEDAQAATEAAKFVDNHRFPPVATEKNRIQNLFMLIVQDNVALFAFRHIIYRNAVIDLSVIKLDIYDYIILSKFRTVISYLSMSVNLHDLSHNSCHIIRNSCIFNIVLYCQMQSKDRYNKQNAEDRHRKIFILYKIFNRLQSISPHF